MTAVPRLDIRNVVKRYGTNTVLNDISLTVQAHEVLTLIGPSGSGKSTLLRCIDLLERIDGGDILVNGQSITARGMNDNAVRRRMGMVFQSWNLFPHMTIMDNVTLGARKALGMPRAEAEAKAMDLLTRIGLQDKATSYPNRISGGQQQRVAICRALIGDPELILLDEITSALDPELVTEVLTLMQELATQGMTMVVATHEMAFARDVSDRIAFLEHGTIQELGPPSQILDNPLHDRTRQFVSRMESDSA